ncbi:MAG: cytidine deaminase [Bdellovibrionales bacterium]|nr:cytidine deaminase [Bdellovibrionales bacterium]
MKPLSEFPQDVEPLLAAARAARPHSYSPYSGFAVGAAIRTLDGRLHAGCNVETVAYNNSLHAEMGAVSKMIASGARHFDAVVVVTDSDEPVFPCGFCLQYLSEFGGDATVYAVNVRGSGSFRHAKLSELLPFQFQGHHIRSQASKGDSL